MDELIMRFEPPSSTRRWENPTYEIFEGDSLPLPDIVQHLTSTFSNHITIATQHAKMSDTNYLHDIDKVTQDIIKAILEGQKETTIGNLISVPNSANRVYFQLRKKKEHLNIFFFFSFCQFPFVGPVQERDVYGRIEKIETAVHKFGQIFVTNKSCLW
eukprot:TRINITY_DN738_c0_g1_i15.p1 TRINITY_DN738_c0_g1~~TRINITY_DN738_c0_g1_i15.p1  ORF type:complete len:158 (+),score=24.70 TRINITY_DN738_c0_g1_i15:297-770(+)